MQRRDIMVIKKLYLTSFGKFDNLEIDLSSGMNVIYGLNEAGKSTVHKFIEGMLFGFFKPSTSRKTYFEDYDKYKPRTKDEYIGSMIIEHNNKDLFISRNFSKTKASLSINDNITGEDLTSEIENNPITKLPDLAGYLGLDYTLYKNTISVSQLGSEDVEKDTSKVVVEKLTNMNSTKSEFINLTKINENLDKMIDKIGNKSKKKKPLYLTQLKIEELKAEKETSENAFEKMRLLSKEISLIDTDIIMCNKNLANIKNKRKSCK
jgi:uncharacterized protein YhaN